MFDVSLNVKLFVNLESNNWAIFQVYTKWIIKYVGPEQKNKRYAAKISTF